MNTTLLAVVFKRNILLAHSECINCEIVCYHYSFDEEQDIPYLQIHIPTSAKILVKVMLQLNYPELYKLTIYNNILAVETYSTISLVIHLVLFWFQVGEKAVKCILHTFMRMMNQSILAVFIQTNPLKCSIVRKHFLSSYHQLFSCNKWFDFPQQFVPFSK